MDGINFNRWYWRNTINKLAVPKRIDIGIYRLYSLIYLALEEGPRLPFRLINEEQR